MEAGSDSYSREDYARWPRSCCIWGLRKPTMNLHERNCVSVCQFFSLYCEIFFRDSNLFLPLYVFSIALLLLSEDCWFVNLSVFPYAKCSPRRMSRENDYRFILIFFLSVLASFAPCENGCRYIWRAYVFTLIWLQEYTDFFTRYISYFKFRSQYLGRFACCGLWVPSISVLKEATYLPSFFS